MDDLGMLCMVGLLLIIGLAVAAFMRRNRSAPQGTYDDPNTRSGGSIGGSRGQPGQRAHDDPNIRSGGSIGAPGGQERARTYDDPNVKSGGSIGGAGARGRASGSSPSTSASTAPSGSTGSATSRNSAGSSQPSSSGPENRERPRHDDPDVRSGGSFGG
jgi:hypothetical protein